jgi:hypothetical protein
MAKCKQLTCQACNERAERLHRFTSKRLCYGCFIEACQSAALADDGDEDGFKSLLTMEDKREIDAETKAFIESLVLHTATVTPNNPNAALRNIQ